MEGPPCTLVYRHEAWYHPTMDTTPKPYEPTRGDPIFPVRIPAASEIEFQTLQFGPRRGQGKYVVIQQADVAFEIEEQMSKTLEFHAWSQVFQTKMHITPGARVGIFLIKVEDLYSVPSIA